MRIPIATLLIPLLAACGGSVMSTEQISPVDEGEGVGGSESDLLDCERIGYPCSFADTPDELLERTAQLLQEGRDIGARGSMQDVADHLSAQPDVADVIGGASSVYFQVEGAPPAWLLERRAGAESRGRSPAAAREPRPETATPPDETPFTLVSTHASRSGMPAAESGSIVGDDTNGDASVDNRDVKRALVLAPYQWDFSPWDESELVAERLGQMPGYPGNVHLGVNSRMLDQNVTLEDWFSFRNYDTVYVATHGERQCTGEGVGHRCVVVISSGVAYDLAARDASNQTPGGMMLAWVGDTEPETSSVIEVGLTPDSFRVGYPGGLTDTLVIFAACETGGRAGNELADALAGRGFVMMGWSEVVPSEAAFSASGAFVEELSLGRSTWEAYGAVVDAGLDRAVDGDGILTVFEYISPNGDDLRLFEIPSIQWNDEPMVDGTDITTAVTGTPGDGEPDQLALTARVAGVEQARDIVLRYEINGQPVPGRYDLGSARSADLPYSVLVDHDVDIGADLPPDRFTLGVVAMLPEGGESRYVVDVVVTRPDEGACSLIETDELNAELGTALTESEAIPIGNSCVWREPLFEDWTKSTVTIVIWDARSGAVLEQVLEGRPEIRVEGSLPEGVDAAWFDPSGTDNPSSIVLDDGSVAISAYANFNFKTHGLLIDLQPAGAVALEGDLEARLLAIAARIAEHLESLSSGG